MGNASDALQGCMKTNKVANKNKQTELYMGRFFSMAGMESYGLLFFLEIRFLSIRCYTEILCKIYTDTQYSKEWSN